MKKELITTETNDQLEEILNEIINDFSKKENIKGILMYTYKENNRIKLDIILVSVQKQNIDIDIYFNQINRIQRILPIDIDIYSRLFSNFKDLNERYDSFDYVASKELISSTILLDKTGRLSELKKQIEVENERKVSKHTWISPYKNLVELTPNKTQR